MLVSQLMTRDPVTVTMDVTVGQVRDLFEDHKFHHLVVTDNQRVVGIISDRDLLASLSPFIGKRGERATDAWLLQRHAHQIMTRHPVCVSEATRAAEAAALLLAHRISCLPVVDEQSRPVGIITWRDLISWSLAQIAHTQERAA